MNRIIECRLDSTYKEIYTGIWQHDYGQILRITGVDLPKAVEVQFSLEDNGGDTLTRIGTTADGATEVKVPDSLLKNENCTQNYLIYAWIYITDDASGNTEYQIILHVKSRPKPEEPSEEPLPEPNIFHETVVAVNASAERAEQALGDVEEIRDNLNLDLSKKITRPDTAKVGQVLAVKEIDESGKPTVFEAEDVKVPTKTSELKNDSGFLTEHQDIGGKLDKEKLPEAIDDALTQAKESGEFNGKDGAPGEKGDPGPKGDPGETTYIENPYDDTKLKAEVDKKLTTPTGNAKVGQILRVQSVNDDGSVVLETVEMSTESVSDIQINGSTIVSNSKIAEIPIASQGKPGVLGIPGETYGLGKDSTNNIRLFGLNNGEIKKRFYGKPLMGNMLDYAVKVVMTDGKGAVWTDLEKAAAKSRIGIDKLERKLEALWKLNQGISYQFETDAEKAYQKDIPSGAKLASVKKIGGRTIVWNQLANVAMKNNVYLNDGNRAEIKIDSDKNTITATLLSEPTNNYHTYINYIVRRFEKGHKYLFSAFFKSNKDCVMRFDKFGSSKMTTQNLKSNIERLCADILICNEDDANNEIPIYPTEKDSGFSVGDWYSMRDFKLFDLTQMFSAGNEPSTPEEFEAMFPKDYYPYNEGTLMSIPVNEVVEQGRNLFDCYGFSCAGIYDENIKRDITNNYGTTISTINPTNSITVTQDKADNSAVISSYANGYFCVGVRMKNNKEYVMSFDFIPTKMLIDNPIMKLLINGDGSNSSGVIDGFSLNVKKHIVVKFTYKSFESRQYIEFRNGGMSGIFENFQLEDGATATAYSPYHKNTYPIPQAILNLDGYGDGVSDDVYNYVDWENKQYHKRVGKVDLGTLPWENHLENVNLLFTTNKLNNSISKSICSKYVKKTNASVGKEDKFYYFNPSNMVVVDSSYSDANDFKVGIQGVMLYYNLAEEEIIDISDIIDTPFQEPIEVEAGGTLTFHNSNGDGYRLPIPNEEEYIVSLAEVGGGGASE